MMSPRRTAPFSRFCLWGLCVSGALIALPRGAQAQPQRTDHVATDAGPPQSDRRATLLAERARVRADLDRVNAEIDALKRESARSQLGMRDDRRLRARLADAEALARSLTDIDARLGASGGLPGTAPAAAQRPALAAEPALSPADGPSEMEAKADILADQSRRVGGRAEALRERARQIKARQDLRRRVGQMEHDPFSPLEGSKRLIIATAAPGLQTTATGSRDSTFGTGSNGPPAAPTITTGPTGIAGAPSAGVAPGGASTASAGSHALVAPPAAPSPTGGAAADAAGTLSVQLRDLLDPATLAQIRRLETSSAPGAGVEALERAAAGLEARAERLRAQAQSLRARARAPH
jgi:hypothetical protein